MSQAFEERRRAAPHGLLDQPPVLMQAGASADVLVLPSPDPLGAAAREGRPARERPPGTRRRLPGLDGLRAFAVLSVVLFHLDYALCSGGFLGVDVFFVISGFLITNLLAREALATGRVDLRRFYVRRARRLLPTVLALTFVVVVVGTTIWRDQLATLRGGALSSLGYVTNWWLIVHHDSYFVASGRPTMFQHLWSLAVEEQYYLVWAVAVAALTGSALALRRWGRTTAGVRRIVVLAVVLCAGSTVWMAIDAAAHDLPYGGSTSPAYYGSGTHSMGLFLGSAAGAAFALRRHRVRPAGSGKRVRLTAVDLFGLAALAVVCYEFFTVDEFRPGLYRGGFLLFDALVLATVLCAVRRGAMFGRLLDMRPIRWLGRRSYSIYVWHWPIVVVTRPGLDIHGNVFWLNVARLLLILGVAALAYRYIEIPLRTGRWRRRRPARPRVRAWTAGAVAISGVSALALGLAAQPLGAQWRLPPTRIAAAAEPAGSARPSNAPARQGGPGSVGSTPSPARGPAKRSPASGTTGVPPSASGLSLSAFGDSVLLGAKVALADHTRQLRLDAVEGRQAVNVLDDVAAQARAGRLAPDVLIHVGDNGIIDPSQLHNTLALLRDRQRVVLMTVRVPRDWEGPNNDIIRSAAGQFANVKVVDWRALSAGHLDDWIYSDGLHLTAAGAIAYTRIVLHAFDAR